MPPGPRLPCRGGLAVLHWSIYGTLSRLFRGGLLTTRVEASASGPHRKYYALSASGRDYLLDGRQAWNATSAAINHLLALSDDGDR